jgi:hypothetical protein
MWYYKGKEFTSEDIGDYIGFVYVITNLLTHKKYVGKKGLMSVRRLPPLKGQKRKRRKVVETDWKKYYGSSEEVQMLVEEQGTESFHREIIRLCTAKGELSYYETKMIFDTDALLKPDEFYNKFVGCKIHRNHVVTKNK